MKNQYEQKLIVGVAVIFLFCLFYLTCSGYVWAAGDVSSIVAEINAQTANAIRIVRALAIGVVVWFGLASLRHRSLIPLGWAALGLITAVKADVIVRAFIGG
ncbi:hypothetical protein ACFLQ1_02310 [Candidatus Auribacterota bacterium]